MGVYCAGGAIVFLNCNYPKECKIPKGRPKGITPKSIKMELKKGNLRLLVLTNGDVYFVKDGYYFGIELPKFLTKNMFGISVFETIGKINIALLEWGSGRGRMYDRLSNEEADLLQTYLLTLR